MLGYFNQAYDNTLRVYKLLDEKQRLKILFKNNTIGALFNKMNYQIRTMEIVMGYGENLYPNNNIVLIGAGDIGKKAYEYFGSHRIAFFADNDRNKIGNKFCGVPIVAVSEIGSLQGEYDIVICSDRYKEIGQQLRGLNILTFYKFKTERIYELEQFLTEHNYKQYKSVSLYGTGKEAKDLWSDLKYMNFPQITYVVDRDDSNFQSKEWNGFHVNKIDDVMDKTDCVMVGSARYHMAIDARLTRLGKDSFMILDPFRLRSYNKKNQLVINIYLKTGIENLTEEEFNQKSSERNNDFDAIAAYINEIEKMDSIPLFGHVEIETINRCNGGCSFCPVSVQNDTRPFQVMTKELFEKIIGELQELDYSGRISPFSNNEPFLDDRIINFTKYMREHLPKARIHLFTNGTLMSVEKYREIMQYLDELIIDNYNQQLKLIEPVEKIKEYCMQHIELISKTDIVLRKQNEVLTTRGGDAPNRHNQISYPKVKCALPYRQLIIRPSGEVSLCCNDALGKYTLGNINDEKIIDIWYGKRFQEIREKIRNGRENIAICKYCDTFYLN